MNFGLDSLEDKEFLGSIKFRAIQGIPTAILVLLPMSLIRDMSGFRYVSFASIIALIYTGVVLLVELPDYAKKYYNEDDC
jgi:hypothetical protein